MRVREHRLAVFGQTPRRGNQGATPARERALGVQRFEPQVGVGSGEERIDLLDGLSFAAGK